MKYSKIINTIFVLALTSVVNAENTCSKKITDKGYKCCSADCVTTYTDEDGNWAVENNQWCGCGNDIKDTNTSSCSINITKKGYSCCPSDCTVVYTDNDGTWGINNNHWCGCNPDDNQTDDNQTDDNKTDDNKTDDNQTDDNQTDDNQTDDNQTNDNQTDDNQTDDNQTDDNQTDDNKSSTGNPDNGNTDDNKPSTGNPNNGNTDDKEPDIQDLINQYNERAKEILADDKEIEKKWLIDIKKIPYDFSKVVGVVINIKQTYICFDPEIRVREYTDRNGKVSHEMTIKTNLTEDGLIRDEVNIDINQEQYDNMIKKQEGNSIYKTRYQFLAEGELIAIDVFQGDLAGLVYMEIEFATKEESDAFGTLDWVIKDVTNDIRYKNGHLARYGIPDPQ